jgi:hypothetical protein
MDADPAWSVTGKNPFASKKFWGVGAPQKLIRKVILSLFPNAKKPVFQFRCFR